MTTDLYLLTFVSSKRPHHFKLFTFIPVTTPIISSGSIQPNLMNSVVELKGVIYNTCGFGYKGPLSDD